MKKNVYIFVLSVLFLTSCQTATPNNASVPNDDAGLAPASETTELEKAPSQPPATATQAPTEIPPATATPTAAPTATAVSKDMVGKFDYPSRVIPGDIDPIKQERKMIELYRAATLNDKHHLEWYGASVASEDIFFLWISTLLEDKTEELHLIYPARAKITLLDIPADHFNVVSPMGGGGGGVINEMQPFILQPGQVNIEPKGEAEVRLDTAIDIGHQMHYICKQTGVFNIHFEFPYKRISKNGDEVENVYPYDVIFACPESFTQYYVDPYTVETKNVVEWIVKDGEYVMQSNQQSQP